MGSQSTTAGAGDSPRKRLLTRRQVLRGGGLVAVGLVGARYVAWERLANALPPDFVDAGSAPSQVVTIRRREDLLDLRFAFWNLVVEDGPTGKRLVRKHTRNPAWFVVTFPPQATAEPTFPAPGGIAPLMVGAAADESRLAFSVPPEIDAIDYSLDGLLSWAHLQPRLVPAATGQTEGPPGGGPGFIFSPVPEIREPHADETAIEIPWRLVLSPTVTAGWAHATGLVTHNGRTEIWHTRMGVRAEGAVDEWNPTGRVLHAVWNSGPDVPVVPPVTHKDRDDIVQATSNRGLDGHAPVDAHRLMLTPLGGWLDVQGRWESSDFSLAEWRHEATMGRDQYVRIVRRGYLFPLGHQAVKIEITERRFEDLFGGVGAILRKRSFIIVQQPTRAYRSKNQPQAAPGQPNEGRAWPFTKVRLTTLITPEIDESKFFVTAEGDGQVFRFAVTAEDLEGRRVDFTLPLVFVDADDAFVPGGVNNTQDSYNAPQNAPHRTLNLSGQKVAMAAPKTSEPGSTAFDVASLVVRAESPTDEHTLDELKDLDQPPFYPLVGEFTAGLSGVDEVAGPDTNVGKPNLALFGDYLKYGFDVDKNPGGVFVEVAGQPPSVQIGADRAGGLATPGFTIVAHSRELGPVGGDPDDTAASVKEIAGGHFDPKDVFSGMKAKLLGGIDLFEIVKNVEGFQNKPGKALSIKTEPLVDGDPPLPVAVRTELTWEPDLQRDAVGLFLPHGDASMTIDAVFVQSLDPTVDSTYDIEGDLRSFDIKLVGDAAPFMTVTFERLRFRARSGHKTEVRPQISDVLFEGPLSFVNKIEDYLSFGGVSPEIQLGADAITAGVGIQLPTIPIGQVLLSDIALSGRLTIPFSGDPARVRFGLSSRENPFNVTYSAIGGGGYFAVGFGLDGIEGVECAIELGAYLSMDLGVVSGSLSVAVGIFFELVFGTAGDPEDPDEVRLEAYMRFNGSVSALGLVTVSLEIYLGLGFEVIGNDPKLVGVAHAELKIKVLVFEGSVKVTVKRTLGSTPKTFADLYTEQHWHDYADAFAPTGGV
jgi:hypothetical protein